MPQRDAGPLKGYGSVVEGEPVAPGLRYVGEVPLDIGPRERSWAVVGEEVDDGKAGVDYVWNVSEGNHDNPYRRGSPPCDEATYTSPIREYSQGTGWESITGSAFVPNGVWLSEYHDAYLFGDFLCGTLFKLSPKSGGGYEHTDFVTGLGTRSAFAVTFGPYASAQALYYTTFDGGEVRRISYTAGNRAAVADVTADPPYSLQHCRSSL